MSVDIPRYPNPCLTTQARNPVKIIDLPTHQSYSTKQQNPPVCIKEQTSTFRDFLMNKVHKPKRSHAKQFEQYREYFKTKQISHLLSCAEAKPNKDSSFDPNANDTGLNEKTTELSLDLSRFKVHIPFTRDVYLSRKAKSVGRRAPLEKTGFVPILAELEEKEANEKETLETDTDLLERQTSMPGDTQRRSDRELDLSRNRDDSKNKLVFSDVPKLYANLRTLHKNYAQNNELQIENEDSGILTDNLKSGGMSQVMEKRENKRLPAIGNITISDMRSKSEKKGLKVARNNSVENNSDRENKVDVADKIRNLIYEEYSIVEDEEGQQQIRDHLKVKMQRFYSPKRRNKSAEPTGPNATPNHGRSVILENRGNSSTKNLNTEDASINSPGKAKNKEDSFMGVPDWLGTRRDFEDGFKKFAEGTSKRILGICSKQSNMRTPDEITTVVEWLQNVKFFAYLPTTLFRNLAEKVRYRRYEKDENLCVVGDVGDCLYIIYEGLVKCYVNGSEVAKYVKFDTPGQAALTGARIRTATLTATATTDVLRLEVKDYLAIMKNFVEQEKEEIIAFLKNISIFNRLNDQQIRKVADRVQTKKYAKGERIYAEGDGAESFFILRQGLLKIETILSIEKHNIWPTALREWTKSKLERKVKFWNPINPKEFFGEIELLKNCRRLNSVVCDKDSQLLILNKADFFGCLGAKELNDLMNASKNNTREDPDTLRSKLLKEEQKKKEMRDVIAGNWTTQLRTLNELELSKRRRKVVEPVMERFNDNLKSFIRENTYKARKIELKVDCNYD